MFTIFVVNFKSKAEAFSLAVLKLKTDVDLFWPLKNLYIT